MDLDRNSVMKRIRAGLRSRSTRRWSVRGGRGTTWGWITIGAAPKRRTQSFGDGPAAATEAQPGGEVGTPPSGGHMTSADQAILASLLGLETVHHQGVQIPPTSGFYEEYVDRAEGKEPRRLGNAYWD